MSGCWGQSKGKNLRAANGMWQKAMIENVQTGTMELLTDWILESDRVLVFQCEEENFWLFGISRGFLIKHESVAQIFLFFSL